MELPAMRVVEALDRGFSPALHTSPGAASGIPMSRLSLTSGSDPKPIVEKRAGNGEARRRQEGGVLLPGKSGRHLGAGEPAGVVELRPVDDQLFPKRARMTADHKR